LTQFILLFFLLIPLFHLPQKGDEKPSYKRSSVVKSYRTSMKDKNFVQARKVVADAIQNHPEAAADPQIYRYKMDAVNELIGAENRKIYLNQRPDTVSFFNYIYELYVTGEQCDSVERISLNHKLKEGKNASPKFRKGIGLTLLPYRNNMLSAGKFHYKKKNYAQAFRFFDMYIKTKESDVFLGSKDITIIQDPDDRTEVSVLSVLSAYGSSNYQGVNTYLIESLKDSSLRPQLIEIGAKSASEQKDTTQMVWLLEQGFESYPETEYFFATLTKHYNDLQQYDRALEKVLRMTELYPEKRDYWYMAGKEQLLMNDYARALVSFQKCVEIQADDAEAHSAIGDIYLHDAHQAYALFNLSLSDPTYAKRKAEINELYLKSCEAYEHARKFDENRQELWLEGLRETYFKLNRGKSLRALEKIVVSHTDSKSEEK